MFKNFIESAKSIKNLRVLCAMALLTALYAVLYAIKIPLVPGFRISFTFIPIAIAGWLFGIFPAVLVGLLGDFLGCITTSQGAYFWGFALTAALNGIVFGSLLYKKDSKSLIWGILISKVLVSFLLNVGLNTYWQTFFFPDTMSFKIIRDVSQDFRSLTFSISSALFDLYKLKTVMYAIIFPFETAVLYGLIKGLKHAGIQKMYK